MRREQRWTPDTCTSPATDDACSLIEEWDDEIPAEARTHNFVRAEKLCSRHAAKHGLDHAAAFSANYEENRRKNVTLAVAQSVNPAIRLEDYRWSFDGDGALSVDFAGKLSVPQKNQLQSFVDIQHGKNRVKVS